MSTKTSYYLPAPSHWPLIGSIALFCTLVGVANWLHGKAFGPYLFLIGALLLVYTIVGWFGTVIKENQAGLYENKQVDRSFRWAMVWFIFSEVMFFAVFFGTLFYVRMFVVPWLGGEGSGELTHYLLWPNFQAAWPVFHTPDPGLFTGPREIMETWGIPAINTLILLSSGVTITIAHWGVIKNKRAIALIGQGLTVLLGVTFLLMQANEYGMAYTEKGLMLSSGIYGATFFMLTGFHALHVTIGTTMLIIIFIRMLKRHFNPHNHFAFEAVSWYWHFVDVVWLLLFIFVYWI